MAASTHDRELYTPFASAESVLLDAAVLLQADPGSLGDEPGRRPGEPGLGRLLGIVVQSAENAPAPPLQAWLALARAVNLLAWQEGRQMTDEIPERIQAGISRSGEGAPPVFSVWGYDERTEAGRHLYVYDHALEYLLDRSAPVPFRLACALSESLLAWEADMLELHPDVVAAHEVTPSRSAAPVQDDVMSRHQLPREADFDSEDLWVLDDVSRWPAVTASRERLLTFRMALHHLHAKNAPVPDDLVRRMSACAAANRSASGGTRT